MSANKLRSWLYAIARTLGDYNAVVKGKIGQRIVRRIVGKLTGRLFSKFFR